MPTGVTLSGWSAARQSIVELGFNFCCTAADITATSAATMALLADADNDTGEGSAARATTDGT